MITRRHLMATAAATLSVGAFPALGQDALIPDYKMPQDMLPQKVLVGDALAPGVVHVNPDEFALYWTLSDGWAMRYAVGIGRVGLYEPGIFTVGARKEWPGWTPTPSMIKRSPEHYAKYAGGMPGGINNPLGSRALYLFTPERGDTFLRIHGTNAPETIGKAVSNGCARLVNDQMIDLYNRVPRNTKVILYDKLND